MTDFTVVEAAVRQLHARYTDAVWRKDYQSFGDLFAEDAEWRMAGRVLRGRVEIVDNLKALMPNSYRILVTFRTPILSVDGNTASGRTYTTEQVAFVDGRPGATIGTYYERFVERKGQWLFAWRLFQLHYLGPADLSGSAFFEGPDYGPPPQMPKLDATTANSAGIPAEEK